VPERDSKLSTCDICHKRVPSVSLFSGECSSGEYDACEICAGGDCNHYEFKREMWQGEEIAQCVDCEECWSIVNGERRKMGADHGK